MTWEKRRNYGSKHYEYVFVASGSIQIVLHRFIQRPGIWFLSCDALELRNVALYDSLKDSKVKALREIRAALKTRIGDMSRILLTIDEELEG